VILLVGSALGCGGEPGRCGRIAVGDQPDDRSVQIGTLRRGPEPIDERFTPWTDGTAQPLLFGFQGGWMLQPTVRVSAQADDPPELCATVTLDHESTAPVEEGPRLSRALTRVGDWHYLGPIDDLLGFDEEALVGRELTIEATVTTERFSSGDTVTVTLAPFD